MEKPNEQKEPSLEVYKLNIAIGDWGKSLKRSAQIKEYRLSNGSYITLGRSSSCHLKLKDQRISRRHCELFYKDDLFIRDSCSRYGTYVNGERLSDNEVKLKNGDKILLGKLPVQVFIDSYGFDKDISVTTGVNVKKALQDRFDIIKLISAGGMGKIYLAQEKVSGRFIALKTMKERFLNQIDFVQQFIREAIITARLEYPNIIPVYDLGFFTHNQLYYTMRYVDGEGNLQELIRNKRRNKKELDKLLRILRDAAYAVNYAHKKNLWHRDLKPSNILIGPDEEVYVIDWGLVSVIPGKSYNLDVPKILLDNTEVKIKADLYDVIAQTNQAVTTITHTGGRYMLGTLKYMSPEQIRNKDLGTKSDIWAFGIMLFEILTGKHPYNFVNKPKRFTKESFIYFVLNEKFPSPRKCVKSVRKSLSKLCDDMLTPSLEDRMESLSIFIKELEHALRA